jgi:hypothetical protein
MPICEGGTFLFCFPPAAIIQGLSRELVAVLMVVVVAN